MKCYQQHDQLQLGFQRTVHRYNKYPCNSIEMKEVKRLNVEAVKLTER